VKKKKVSSREGCEEMEWVTWETKDSEDRRVKKKARKRRVRDSHKEKKSGGLQNKVQSD